MSNPLKLQFEFSDENLKKLAKLIAAESKPKAMGRPAGKKPAAAEEDEENVDGEDGDDGDGEEDGEEDEETPPKSKKKPAAAEDDGDDDYGDGEEDDGEEDDAPTATKEDVLKAMRALEAATSRAIAVKVLKDVGGVVKGLSELKPGKFGAVLEACKKKTAAAKAKKKAAGK